MMAADDVADDAALFASMRRMWDRIDPVPADMIDRMVAAVAVEDVSREYEMLTLVEDSLSAVRAETDTATLQFSDGTTTVLLHITASSAGRRRIDGWVDGPAPSVRLVTIDAAGSERERTAVPGEHGRFAFEEIPAGTARLHVTVTDASGQTRESRTPQFEV